MQAEGANSLRKQNPSVIKITPDVKDFAKAAPSLLSHVLKGCTR